MHSSCRRPPIRIVPLESRAAADVRVPFIGLAAFIRNKRASRRTKDFADLELIGEA